MGDNAKEILNKLMACDEPALINLMLASNELQQLPELPGKGEYEYVKRSHAPKKISLGKTLFLAPHPSDVSADLSQHLVSKIRKLDGECKQILLTRGEDGDSTKTQEDTIMARLHEEEASARITGINVDYLTRDGGTTSKILNYKPAIEEVKRVFYNHSNFFPDGKLLENLDELTDRLADYISSEQPDRLIIPSLYLDHPDHLATAIAAINAVVKLRDKGYFEKNHKIEILASAPEFGVAIGQPWAVKVVEEWGRPEKIYQHGYVCNPQTGLLRAAPNITKDGGKSFTVDSVITMPNFIVPVSAEEEENKITALLEHQTQVGNGHPYKWGLPAFDVLLGGMLPKGAKAAGATGIFQINIPGATTKKNSLIDALPEVYQLKRNAQLVL